ncbi:MAG TPA: hypothetical protein RMH99_08690 [Sandaracinaceae bacterium LLY-WYZ-13_1]|nr:hypothetical protein [Sandaracinaceae bacterium LLY-WYZ-13_1]
MRHVGRLCALCVLLFAGCSEGSSEADAGPPVAERWARARALWHIRRDPGAWAAWHAIDPDTPEGREARALLEEAEPHYRRLAAQVADGDPRVRETFERAVRIAPMDPALYLPLARAYRTQARTHPENSVLVIRAVEYYRKFLALRPDHPEAPAARRELARLDPEASRLFFERPLEATEAVAPPAASASPPAPTWPFGVAFAALALAGAAVVLLVIRSRRRAESLGELASRRPELHPAIAYLVGSLRHELLKHRIGAVGDAVDALGRGAASEEQRAFLRGRLFGGEPLDRAWEGHLGAFERALGPELDLRRRDPAFRRADRAIRRIASLAPRVEAEERRAVARLARAHGELRALDRHLAKLVRRLVRTPVDGALLRAVVDEVRGEYAAGRVALDEVSIRAPEPAPRVEVFRVDLVLVLKNVVRNAILAVGQEAPPRRIGLDVSTEVELTGEETVRIRVRDTSTERFTTEDIYARRMDRGLGLVTAALGRYDGAIAVEPGDDGWEKAVVVRFFRAFDDDDEAREA